MPHFECCHADTCLPSYWSGHHQPHVQIIAFPGMSLDDIKEALHHEIDQQAIAGSVNVDEQPDEWYESLKAAVEKIVPVNSEQTQFFNHLEESEDIFEDSVYAFFVFMEIDEEEE